MEVLGSYPSSSHDMGAVNGAIDLQRQGEWTATDVLGQLSVERCKYPVFQAVSGHLLTEAEQRALLWCMTVRLMDGMLQVCLEAFVCAHSERARR